MENHKKRKVHKKTKFRVWESVTHREGISTLPCPPKGGTFN